MNFDLVVFASLRRGRRASLGVGVGRGDEREREMRIVDGGHVHLLPVYSVCILIAPVRVGG